MFTMLTRGMSMEPRFCMALRFLTTVFLSAMVLAPLERQVETSIGKNEVTVEESGTNDPAADFVRKTLEGLS